MSKKTIKPICWFCGDDFRVTIWTCDGKPAPMCRLHSATTMAGLALRALGNVEAADQLDEAVGIDTRPTFCELEPPKAQVST